jgi:molybdopterin/thiamine biosynthesis adenylyltransferase
VSRGLVSVKPDAAGGPDAGAIRFSAPINHFDVILNELDDCARRERIDDASLN